MFLDVLRALNCPSDCIVPNVLPVGFLLVNGWPHHDHSITNELDDIATILIQIADHSFHIAIDGESQLFVTSGTFLSAGFSQVCETADVSKDDDGLHGLKLGQGDALVG